MIVKFPKKRMSPVVTPIMAAKIKSMLGHMNQHDIAAHFGINQGRVSEINTGMKFPGVEPAQLEFPFDG